MGGRVTSTDFRHENECPTWRPMLVGDMRTASVYLGEAQAARLFRLAQEEGRSQAEILRAAIDAYRPQPSVDWSFAVAAGFRRLDDDPRPISQIPQEELLEGFGA